MKKFTIFGNPVEHSISPKMHTFILEGLGIEGEYTKYLLKDPFELKKIFFDLKFDGANVTVPHKEAAFAQCDEVRGIAKDICAVNVLVSENGKMVGYNTDCTGFYESIKDFIQIQNSNKTDDKNGKLKILILGAGGTAKSISLYLVQKGFDVCILNRSKKRLEFFREAKIESFCFDEFETSKDFEKWKSCNILVNTTSAGLNDEELPAPQSILETLLNNCSLAYDVIYNKKTPFLNLANSLGVQTKDGSDMLLYQGILAFNLFFGNIYDLEVLKKYGLKAFRS